MNYHSEYMIQFYADGRKRKYSESCIRAALQALLASPQFLFRIEEMPAGVKPGQNYRIADVDLASRLSYFIWGTAPDAELLKAASSNTLHTPAVLAKPGPPALPHPTC